VQQSPTFSREAQHLLAIGFRISRLGQEGTHALLNANVSFPDAEAGVRPTSLPASSYTAFKHLRKRHRTEV
jgi:hypothetical protein